MNRLKHGIRGFWMIPLIAIWMAPAAWASPESRTQAPGRIMAQQAIKERELWITADHAKHEILQQEFASGPEVTAACLTCHSEAAAQFHKTIHWTWLDPNVPADKRIGKAGVSINNFCISIHGNEPRCTSCHAGYGWKDADFDFTDPTKVDCLVCHEQTGTYKKYPAGAGNPVREPKVFKGNQKQYLPPDWNKVAQSVGRPTRQNCGSCHFYGGGGDGVKHGDMDSSLMNPDKALDVHMGVDGQNFDCSRCHTTQRHRIAGRTYATPAVMERKSLVEDDLASKITCESCHTDKPHKPGVKANDHTDKVACQSCHIPTFARTKPTKMGWDWSTAGDKREGKPYTEKGPYGKASYHTKKGDFVWEKNVKPEYHWFNGSIESITAEETIDPDGVVAINGPAGNPEDPNSRIFPFKVHRGKQPYDTVNKTLLIPHLFGKKGSDAYWANYDWQRALKSGMAKAGLEFSGEYDFVETSYVFPITHMVAPKENTVACTECHARAGGRLANLTGVYMPGRDISKLINIGGWALVLASLFGVLVHGFGRFFANGRKGTSS